MHPDLQATDLIIRLDNLAKTHLPRYAIPRYWISLCNLSSDANGKQDHRWVRNTLFALTREELARFAVQRPVSRVVGQSLEATKEKVLGNWIAQVLGPREIFKHSNFVTLLGDSIFATRLCSLANYHGLRILVNDIYQNPTAEQLDGIARKTQASTATTAIRSEGMVYHTAIIEWFLGLKIRNPHWFSQKVAIKFKLTPDLEKLPLLLESIIRIHPSLRIA